MMKNIKKAHQIETTAIRWPFKVLMMFCFILLFYKVINKLINNPSGYNVFVTLFMFVFIVSIWGFIYRPIKKGTLIGEYFFNYKLNIFNKWINHKPIVKPNKPKTIYFKQIRIGFDKFLASKKMVQIWGALDLLTLVLFWQYFYNNIILVHGVLYNNIIVKFSMIPHYLTVLVSISLLFSGILLIIPSKLGGRIVGVQMLLKMFAYLPSIFPILWLMGFTIEHRYIKALVITTLCIEFIRVVTIRHYFQFDKKQNYSGYDDIDNTYE